LAAFGGPEIGIASGFAGWGAIETFPVIGFCFWRRARLQGGRGDGWMRRAFIFACALLATVFMAGSAAVFGLRAPASPGTIAPVWTESKWPFLIDQWGTGRAFVCMPSDCGVKVEVYVRPKIGFCNCSSGVSDDAELERVSDTTLVGPEVHPLGPGRPIKVGWMAGLSRAYLIADETAGARLLSVAFNDECDVVVAVATLGNGDPEVLGPAVMAFLNSNPMVLWAKKELGLEFVRREW
jgi:hypothetical protein